MNHKSAFILCHTTGKAGGLYNLKQYLAANNVWVSELLHPLDDYEAVPGTFTNEEGEVITISRKNRGVLNYLEDFYLSVRYIQKSKFDIFIGCSNFDTIPAIFCRIFLRKKISKLIYYPRDYSEGRFGNTIMDKIYQAIEKIASRHSDLVISNTKRAEDARVKLGLRKERSQIIPNPVSLKKPVFNKKVIDKSSFIYVGDVSREHGLYELIEVLTPYIKKLVIIGSGKDWDRTVSYAQKQSFDLDLHHAKSHEFVIKYLQQYNGVGLAPYNTESKWTYYCSPLKVGEYIACGLPVITSDVPEVASIIQDKDYGITYHNLNARDIIEKLHNFGAIDFYKKSKKFYKDNNTQTLYSGIEL